LCFQTLKNGVNSYNIIFNFKVLKHIDIFTFEEGKGTGWWEMGIWRLKGVRGNVDKGVCPVCRKEGGSHPAV
jgi:hypothetical protein